jgi:hypothetical protein
MAGGPFTSEEKALWEHDWPNEFNTKLTPKEQEGYSKRFSDKDREDYDMQGWYKENKDNDGHTGHYPDKYKKPNHPTFSDESIYSGKDGYTGGHWSTDGKAFTPGSTNLKYHSNQELEKYFKEREPGVTYSPLKDNHNPQ